MGERKSLFFSKKKNFVWFKILFSCHIKILCLILVFNMWNLRQFNAKLTLFIDMDFLNEFEIFTFEWINSTTFSFCSILNQISFFRISKLKLSFTKMHIQKIYSKNSGTKISNEKKNWTSMFWYLCVAPKSDKISCTCQRAHIWRRIRPLAVFIN